VAQQLPAGAGLRRMKGEVIGALLQATLSKRPKLTKSSRKALVTEQWKKLKVIKLCYIYSYLKRIACSSNNGFRDIVLEYSLIK
jgi:hypothetical protein